MTVVYVLIKCDLCAEEPIIEKLKKEDEIKDVFETFGAHDIMAKVESDNLENLRETIARKIQKIEKIRSTVTLIKKDSKS